MDNDSIDPDLKRALSALQGRDPATAKDVLENFLARTPAPTGPARMLAFGLLAPACASLGQLEPARAAAAEAVALAEAAGDAESLKHYSGHSHQLAMDEQALEEVLERAMAALDRGDPMAAEADLRTVLIASLAHQQSDLEATARGMMAQAMLMRGAPEEARPHIERAMAIAREMGDPGAEGHFAALLAAATDGEAADRYRRQGELAKRVDDAATQAGRALEAGDWENAVASIDGLAEEAKALDALESEATLRGLLSQAWLMGNRRQEAVANAKRAVELAEKAGAREAADAFRGMLQLAVGLGIPVEKA
jgi:hypothetical protein